ncbi:MAG: hypothetical protein WBD98_15195, partial [Acidobacteriaceae bacterium]
PQNPGQVHPTASSGRFRQPLFKPFPLCFSTSVPPPTHFGKTTPHPTSTAPTPADPLRAIQHPRSCAVMIAILAAIDLGIWAFNRHQSRSTVLYYEELEPEVITTLGLASGPLRSKIEM